MNKKALNDTDNDDYSDEFEQTDHQNKIKQSVNRL